MSTTYVRRILMAASLILLGAAIFVMLPSQSRALNIHSYKDLISDSKPGEYANHTLSFQIKTNVAPGGYIEVQPPSGFEIISTSTFAERNIELYVNGVPRVASSTLDTNVDQVVINPGAPGSILYNLNPSTGIAANSQLELRIGNHTSNASYYGVSYSTTTGTTTTYRDIEPIKNSMTVGTHRFFVNVEGGDDPAFAEFNIAVVNAIQIENVDTTEDVPPLRFNGAPTGTIGGTTFTAELSLETNELAECRMSQSAGVSFNVMNDVFSNTGILVHSEIKQIATGTTNTYYVRCIDDEGNFNTDDFVITFISLPPPVGTPNDDGEVEGDGTGSGDSGNGGGSNSGGTSGGTGGSGSSGGSSSGSGGSGGGGGGGSGDDDEDESGGGFEPGDNPYRSGDAEVIIRGYAFPGSTVNVLVDGNAAETTRAGNDGSYSVTLEAIARGVYTFGVYAIGSDKVKSSTFSTSFTVTGGRTSNLSNINVMPSIKATPDPVDPGESLTLSGYSIPNAEITIENQNDKSTASKKTFTTTSGSNGSWSLSVDTSGFTAGTYKVRAKSKQLSGLLLETNFSGYTFYGVGQSANVPLSADLNTDGKVNLTDFSILLFWWGGNGGNSNPPADINRDGNVSLTDFSIMLFNWTG